MSVLSYGGLALPRRGCHALRVFEGDEFGAGRRDSFSGVHSSVSLHAFHDVSISEGASSSSNQIYKFECFELILLLKSDQRFPVEHFEATASQSAAPSPPLSNIIVIVIIAYMIIVYY